MTVRSAEKNVYEARSVNKVIFIKNVVEYSDDYARTVVQDEFWYLDTVTATGADARNKGIRARGKFSNRDKTVKTVVPLNRYSFFEELSDKLLPPMLLQFEIELENDTELIYQNDGTGRRIVVTKMELWVPKLLLKPEGQKLVNENLLKPMTKWSYLQETLIPDNS